MDEKAVPAQYAWLELCHNCTSGKERSSRLAQYRNRSRLSSSPHPTSLVKKTRYLDSRRIISLSRCILANNLLMGRTAAAAALFGAGVQYVQFQGVSSE